MKSTRFTTILLGAALLAGAAIGQTEPLRVAQQNPRRDLTPPPMRNEVVPAARAGWIWAPGWWDWDGRRHVWVRGQWLHERTGYLYRQPNWFVYNGEWILDRGGWAREGEIHTDPSGRPLAPGQSGTDRSNMP